MSGPIKILEPVGLMEHLYVKHASCWIGDPAAHRLAVSIGFGHWKGAWKHGA
jgi:hypothetical protein